MNNLFLKAAAFLGALSVALGAFGSHGLKKILSTELLAIFETAVKYQFYHVFGLLAIGILYITNPANGWLSLAGKCMIAGITIFSGSLYLLCYAKQAMPSLAKIIGPITPIGGLCLIAGWVFLLLAIVKK
ncbi:MAG: DUF423 domain-containing protein [Chitinophagaceae bacterium]